MPENQALKVSIFDKFQDDKLFTQVWDRPLAPCFLFFLFLPFPNSSPKGTDRRAKGGGGWLGESARLSP